MMVAPRRSFLMLLVAAVLSAATPVRAAEKVDLLLVLAADVSRSVDDQKFLLQREGYAAAITNPRVLDAVRSGPNGRIALCFVEWSGLGAQKIVVGWQMIGDAKSAAAFAAQIRTAPRSFADRTSISGGIEFAVAQLEAAPFESNRRTIDVSGDGTNNSGREVTFARDAALNKGITINGIVILSEQPLPWNPEHTNPPGGLANYYRDNVIGGPGAFVMTAEDFGAFGKAMIGKMIAEVAMRPDARRAELPQSASPR
jgi:hypothetical protein